MNYQLKRSQRHTIALEMTPQGVLLVRAPMRLSKGAIDAFVASQQVWIEHQLAKRAEMPLPLSKHEMDVLRRQAAIELPSRVVFFAQKLGVTYGRITIRTQKTRWGSCSGKGNLNFNSLLMLAPESVRDYVVVHELCHLKEMNHSRAFWQLVERVLPAYKKERQWLREHGMSLMARRGEY